MSQTDSSRAASWLPGSRTHGQAHDALGARRLDVEHVAGHNHYIDRLRSRELRDTGNRVDARGRELRTITTVELRVTAADLPVGGVQHFHEVLPFRRSRSRTPNSHMRDRTFVERPNNGSRAAVQC
jgi:hypothetical protein